MADHAPGSRPGDEEDLDEAADTWLVRQAAGGDIDAYEVLVRRHRNRIYRIALRMLSNPDDAEDVAQDVVIQLWTALAGFAGDSSFTTWLYRIVVNRCLNMIRQRRPTRPILDTDPPPVAGTDEKVVARHRVAAAMSAIGDLPPDLRAVLVLHQIEGLSYQEVATILNVSEPTVRGRLHRGRRLLLQALRSWA